MDENNALNRFTLSFESNELEQQFRQEYLGVYRSRINVTFLIIIVSVAAFMVSDYLYWHEAATLDIAVNARIILISGITALWAVCRFSNSVLVIDTAVMAGLLMLSAGLAVINYHRPADYIAFLELDTVIIFAVYTFLQSRFVFQLFTAMVFTVIDLSLIAFIKEISGSTTLFTIFFGFFLVNVVGIYAARRYHVFHRKLFASLLKERDYSLKINESLKVICTQNEKLEEMNAESIRREQELKSITENVNDIIFSLDNEGRYQFIGPQIKRYGLSPDEMIGKFFYEFLEDDFREPGILEYSQVMNGQKEPVPFQFRITNKKGESVWFEENGQLAYNPTGKVTGITGVLRDITKRKQVEEEKEQLIVELKEALQNIKTLKELLPICSNCKKIRNDDGYYEQVEVYITKHTDTYFSHGICPDCLKELYPDYYDECQGSDES